MAGKGITAGGVCEGNALLCEEVAVGEVGQQWAYKGEGRGDYKYELRYVGEGNGNVGVEAFGARTWRLRWCVLLLIFFFVFLAAALALYFLLRGGVGGTKVREAEPPHMAPNCEHLFWNWHDAWSPEKKEYCCRTASRGCPEEHVVVKTRVIRDPPPRPHVVYRNHYVKVPDEQFETRTKYVSVPSPTLAPKVVTKYKYKYIHPDEPDCDAGFYNWQEEWSDTKKEWCCEHRNKACYDCKAGVSNWRHGWSHRKKVWCCDLTGDYCDYEQEGELRSCKLWGDPHVVTFDKSHLVFYSEGDFWIVKSPRTKIQGRFQATRWTKDNDHTDYSSMTSILVAGGVMGHGDTKLEVQSMEGKILCNDHEILEGFGTTTCGRATVTFGAKGKLVDSAMAFLPHKVVHIALPDGYWIQVNRWPNFINALVTMRAEGQDGICGNFNGLDGDDSGEELHQRFGRGVQSYEDLFSYHLPLHVPRAKPSPKRCGVEKLDRAAHACTHRIHEASAAWSFAECMGDFCDNAKGEGADTIGYQAREMKHYYMHHHIE